MHLTAVEFYKHRQPFKLQYFPHPNPKGTIAIHSYIWWTDHIGLALINAGYNVLFAIPLYLLYTDPSAFNQFDSVWNSLLAAFKQVNPSLIIGGNTSALCPHVNTKQLFHDAANLPVIHYWWDELRTMPHFAAHGFSPEDYLSFLGAPRTLNAIWDIDVLEELQTFHNLHNTTHLPLATLPEFWPQGFTPLEQRPLDACFLGNCHYLADWADTDRDPLIAWARTAIDAKQANLDRPMHDCLTAAGPAPLATTQLRPPNATAWTDFTLPWEYLNGVWMYRTRNKMLKAAASHLRDKLTLIGKGWESLGLKALTDHAQMDSGAYYQRAKVSLNLFGGCVHGGMPLRPFDIAASTGLLLTHYARELPNLFAPNECLAFRTEDEMLLMLDRLLSHPADFNPIPPAANRRLLSHHTWSHRVEKLLQSARQHLNWHA